MKIEVAQVPACPTTLGACVLGETRLDAATLAHVRATERAGIRYVDDRETEDEWAEVKRRMQVDTSLDCITPIAPAASAAALDAIARIAREHGLDPMDLLLVLTPERVERGDRAKG